MKKVNFVEVNTTDSEFKRIKKGKQYLIIRINNEENGKIKVKDKIILKNGNKKLKRKVLETKVFKNLEELSNNVTYRHFGYKKKDIFNHADLIKDFTESDIKKYGLLGIRFKRKRRKIRNLILIALGIFLLYGSINLVKDFKAKKLNDKISELIKDKINYVFLEINPSFVLTVKNNVTQDIACLNKDCLSMYEYINIKEKDISESIDIIYNLAKEKGFDVSKGVYVKTTSNIEFTNKGYLKIERIDFKKEQEFLNEVKNNDSIKNINNNDYYANLLKELKKDSDYDYTYTCNMDNSELKCYFTEKFLKIIGDLTIADIPKLPIIANDMSRTLKRFNVKYETEDLWMGLEFMNGIYINGDLYHYLGSSTHGYQEIIDCKDMGSPSTKNIYNSTIKITYDASGESCRKNYDYFYKDVLVRVEGNEIIPIQKFNLLNSSYEEKDILDEHIKAKDSYDKSFIDGTAGFSLDNIGIDKWLFTNKNKDAFYLCNNNADSDLLKKKDNCEKVTKTVYNNIMNLKETCHVSASDFAIKRDLECQKNETTYERCNIDKTNYTKKDCTSDYSIKEDYNSEGAKVTRRREELFNKGYAYNKKGTEEKCSDVLGFCEYLCLYKKDTEGNFLWDEEPITCELLIIKD